MVAIPKTGTLRLIDSALVKKAGSQPPRRYLGCSYIGNSCLRAVWYDYYQPSPVTNPRILRIFDFGHWIEDYIVGLLKDSGIKVFEKDDNGKQFGVEFHNGRLKGHIDGVVTGLPESSLPHLLEIKSAKNTIFNQFKKKGVKSQSVKYYSQVQIYMHGMGLKRCLFIIMNKDTSEIYIERIEYNEMYASMILDNALEILESPDTPVDREFAKSTHFLCKMCHHYDRCWKEEEE